MEHIEHMYARGMLCEEDVIHSTSMLYSTPPYAAPKVELTPAAHAHARMSNRLVSLFLTRLNRSPNEFMSSVAKADVTCTTGPSLPTDKPDASASMSAMTLVGMSGSDTAEVLWGTCPLSTTFMSTMPSEVMV